MDILRERKEIDKIFNDNFKFSVKESKIEDIIKECSGKALYKLVREAEETLPQEPAFVKGSTDKLQAFDPQTKSVLKPKKVVGSDALEARDDTEPLKPDSSLKEEEDLEGNPAIEEPATETPVETGEVPGEEPLDADDADDAGEDEAKSVSELIADIEADLAVLKIKVGGGEEPVEEPIEEPVEEPAEAPVAGEEGLEGAEGQEEELVEKKEEEEVEEKKCKEEKKLPAFLKKKIEGKKEEGKKEEAKKITEKKKIVKKEVQAKFGTPLKGL